LGRASPGSVHDHILNEGASYRSCGVAGGQCDTPSRQRGQIACERYVSTRPHDQFEHVSCVGLNGGSERLQDRTGTKTGATDGCYI